MTRDRSDQVCFAVSREVRDALNAEAFENDESRSATIRHILVDHLRCNGLLGSRTAPTHHLGRTNRCYKQNAK